MITEYQYYQKLYDIFIKKNDLLFKQCLMYDFSVDIPKPEGEEYQKLLSLLSIIEKKYGFEMHLNYKQLYMWQKTVMHKLDIERMLTAGKLVLFCCLIDNLLDSPRFSAEEKDKVCEKAGTSFFFHDSNDKKYLPELDSLAQDVLKFYQLHPADPVYSEWKEDLYSSFQSEVYMYQSILKKNDKLPGENICLLLDKSVKFEKTAFLTATYNYNTVQSVEAAELLGEIFWLVDDLCDFIEDVHAGRKNSLLYYCVKETGTFTLEERIDSVYSNLDIAVDHLNNVMDQLKKKVSGDMFSFMIVQIWKWFHHVRKVAE